MCQEEEIREGHWFCSSAFRGIQRGVLSVAVYPFEYLKDYLQGIKSGPEEILAVIFFIFTLQKKDVVVVSGKW